MQVQLRADMLAHLGGGTAGAMIDAEIGHALKDLDERGSDEKVRKVTITLSIFRMSEKNTRDIGVDVDAKHSIPPYESGTTICAMELDGRGNPIAKFQPDTLRHDQPSIPFPEHPENR